MIQHASSFCWVRLSSGSARYFSSTVSTIPSVPWFPQTKFDLDLVANRTLCAGSEIESDHPGFNDPAYRERRHFLGTMARQYKAGNEIPRIEYSQVENDTWGQVYKFINGVHKQYACQEYLNIVPLMEKHCGFSENNIPQVQDISAFLKGRTGFTIRPVAGLLSSRDFLNALAFRIFCSTQFIRHHSMPLYTPEPDICHELLGHAPMFADAEFADFSQEIGLASLGATDEEVGKLVALYWFTVEFGMIRDPETKETKAFGAGLLSSCGELEYSCTAERRREMTNTNNENKALEESITGSNRPFDEFWDIKDALAVFPEIKRFTPQSIIASVFDPPISKYQPKYYVATDLTEVKSKVLEYCNNMKRPFRASYDHDRDMIVVDKDVLLQPLAATAAKVGTTMVKPFP